MHKSLRINKRDDDNYSVSLEAPEGKVICEVSVARQAGASDRRTPREKEKEARTKLKRLAEEFSAIFDSPTEQGADSVRRRDQPLGLCVPSVRGDRSLCSFGHGQNP